MLHHLELEVLDEAVTVLRRELYGKVQKPSRLVVLTELCGYPSALTPDLAALRHLEQGEVIGEVQVEKGRKKKRNTWC